MTVSSICRCFLALAASLCLWQSAPHAVAQSQGGGQGAGIPEGVRSIVQRHGFPLSSVGLLILGATGEPIAAINPDKPFNIASVAKVFTTVAGMDVLGLKHTWRTAFYHDGEVADGVLRGNLYLVGEGDPFLTKDHFQELVTRVRRRGISVIDGDIVVDDTFFSIPKHNPNAFDGAGLKPYNVGPSAVLLNYNTFEVSLIPVLGENRVSLHLEPPSKNVKILDGVTLRNGRGRNWRGRIRERYDLGAAGSSIRLTGQYPRRCGSQSFHVGSLLDHVRYAGGVFMGYWEEQGGQISGKVRAGKLPQGAALVAARDSEPMPRIMRGVNKFSNNAMARQVFLALGKDEPKTLERSREALTSWLTLNGIDPEGFYLDNGSGLSREVRATPRQTAEVLAAGWRGKWRSEIFGSFPVAGHDGTLRKRLRNVDVAGYARLKTGSLRGARSIAGMLHHPSHGDVIFVALVNGSKVGGARGMFDDLIRWTFEEMDNNGQAG